MRSLVLVFAIAMAVVGCSTPTEMNSAEQAVSIFHEMLDAGQFEAIYVNSADDLRKATNREHFTSFLAAVHRRLGNTKAANKQGWRVDYQTSGRFVTLSYATVYEHGEASEQFVFRVQGTEALLVGYRIKSDAFVIREL